MFYSSLHGMKYLVESITLWREWIYDSECKPEGLEFQTQNKGSTGPWLKCCAVKQL